MTFLSSLHSKDRRLRTGAAGLSAQAGFTLIELLVVMGIMLVITSLILAKHSQFNGTVLLRNLSYSIALSIRQAQVYGLSGRSVGGMVGTQFGAYFTAANPTQYLLFIDLDDDAAYDSGESIEEFRLAGSYAISNLCADTGTLLKCSGSGDIDRLTIIFRRPNPDARFLTDIPGEEYTRAVITVLSAQGATRTIEVTTTGQIEVQQD